MVCPKYFFSVRETSHLDLSQKRRRTQSWSCRNGKCTTMPMQKALLQLSLSLSLKQASMLQSIREIFNFTHQYCSNKLPKPLITESMTAFILQYLACHYSIEAQAPNNFNHGSFDSAYFTPLEFLGVITLPWHLQQFSCPSRPKPSI